MYLPKKRYEELEQALRHVPEEILNIRGVCPNLGCGVSFQPDWLKKIPPMTPIRPNSGQGMWIRTGAQAECLACHTELVIPPSRREAEGQVQFFRRRAIQGRRRQESTHLLAGRHQPREASRSGKCDPGFQVDVVPVRVAGFVAAPYDRHLARVR